MAGSNEVADRTPRRSAPHRRRRGVGAVLTMALSGLVVVGAPGVAHAAGPCANPPSLGDFAFVSVDNVGGSQRRVLVVFYLKAPPTRTFNPAESAAVDNQLSTPAAATFSSTQSRTFTITNSQSVTTSVGTMQSVAFQAMASQSVQSSMTTAIGITTTVTVPPFGRVQADFGVQAFLLHYDVDIWELGDGLCWWRPEMSRHDVFSNAPTNIQEWQVRQA